MLEKNEELGNKIEETDAEKCSVYGAPAFPDFPINAEEGQNFVILVLKKILYFLHVSWDCSQTITKRHPELVGITNPSKACGQSAS
jgi:hypothetical protein